MFILLATRGHDILYSDWGEKIVHRSVHRVDSFVYYTVYNNACVLSIIFREFNFCSSLALRKFFNNKIFPNYGT